MPLPETSVFSRTLLVCQNCLLSKLGHNPRGIPKSDNPGPNENIHISLVQNKMSPLYLN